MKLRQSGVERRAIDMAGYVVGDPAGELGLPIGHVAHRLHRAAGLQRLLMQSAPRVGEGENPWAPVDQPLSDQALQPGQRVGQTGLGAEQAARCRRDSALLGNHQEGHQKIPIKVPEEFFVPHHPDIA